MDLSKVKNRILLVFPAFIIWLIILITLFVDDAFYAINTVTNIEYLFCIVSLWLLISVFILLIHDFREKSYK